MHTNKVSKANIVCSSSQAVDTDECVVANSLESDGHACGRAKKSSKPADTIGFCNLTHFNLDTITQ